MTPDRRTAAAPGTLDAPGAIIDPLEQCMLHCLRASPTGWSSTADLIRDLEAFFGVTVSVRAVGRAMRELGRTRRIHVVVDDARVVWYRIRPG